MSDLVLGGRCLTIGVAHLYPPQKYYRMTDTCDNITFARFAMRAVKKEINMKENKPPLFHSSETLTPQVPDGSKELSS